MTELDTTIGGVSVKMEKCPHCESDEGYYEKYYVSGSAMYRHRFDGNEAENGDMHEGLSYKLKSKFAFCIECHKRLFRL